MGILLISGSIYKCEQAAIKEFVDIGRITKKERIRSSSFISLFAAIICVMVRLWF